MSESVGGGLRESNSVVGEEDQQGSQLEMNSLWKKKMSIVEPTSVYHNEDGDVVTTANTTTASSATISVQVEIPSKQPQVGETAVPEGNCGKETSIVDKRLANEQRRATFKQRAQQRQREIDQLKLILRAHQPIPVNSETESTLANNRHPIQNTGHDPSLVEKTNQNQEPFDFERMEKQQEIDSRFHQFCRSHNKLNKKTNVGLLRAHLIQIEENTKRRFHPSCKSRRLQSASGSLSLISKTPQQLGRMLASLNEEQCKQQQQQTDAHDNNIEMIPQKNSPSIIIDDRFDASISSSFQITNYTPHQTEFEEEVVIDHKKSFKVLRTANSTIQFSQWKSVFSKNNK